MTADFCLPAPYGWKTYREKSDMQAVKLRPEEVLGGPLRSDWLLLWRLLPRGLPSSGEAGTQVEREKEGGKQWDK